MLRSERYDVEAGARQEGGGVDGGHREGLLEGRAKQLQPGRRAWEGVHTNHTTAWFSRSGGTCWRDFRRVEG